MRPERKKFFATSLLYGITGSFASLINLIIIPVIEGKERLNALDFSQIAIVESITVLIYLISFFSAGSAISRFYWEFKDSPGKINRLISSVVSFILLRGLVLLGIILIVSRLPVQFFTQPELQHFGAYAVPALIIGVTRAIVNSVSTLMRNQRKIFVFTGFNIITTLIRASCQLAGVFIIEFSFMGYVYGSLIGSVFILIMTLGYIWYIYGFHISYKVIKEIRVFSYPIFIYEIILWIITYADRFFLEKYPVDMGIYDIAMRFALGIRMIILGFQGASQPEFFDLLSRPKTQETNRDLRLISNMQIAQTLFIIMIAILPTVYYLLNFCESNISEASKYIPLIFALSVIKSQNMIFTLPILFEKKTKLMLIANSAGIIVSLSINYFLIPFYGVYAAITASLLSDVSILLILFFMGKSLKTIQWNVRKTVFVPFMVIAFALLMEYLSHVLHLNPYLHGTLITVFITISLLLLYFKELYRYLRRYLT